MGAAGGPARPYRPGPGPLEGLRVVELATYVAGPLGGMTLAQLGAEVIRVDPVGGAADTRRLPLSPAGTSLYWTGLNKNKRSVVVDLATGEGRELVARLATAPGADAGFVLTNAVGRGWLAHEELARRRGDVVSVRITGDHEGGAAVDYTANARAGFPAATGPRGWEAPVNHLLPAWDVACGCLAAAALLGADRHRRRTGQGQEVVVPLVDVAMAVAGHLGYLAEAQVLGRDRQPDGNYLYGAFGKDFRLADDERVMVVALTPRQWDALVEATGTAEAMGALERTYGLDLGDPGDLYRAREAVAALLAPWFAARGLAEVQAAFDGTAVLWDRYRSFAHASAELAADPTPLFGELDQPGVGSYLAPRAPLAFLGTGQPAPAPAPTLGADTTDILVSVLGLDPAEVDRLHADGVVASPSGAS